MNKEMLQRIHAGQEGTIAVSLAPSCLHSWETSGNPIKAHLLNTKAQILIAGPQPETLNYKSIHPLRTKAEWQPKQLLPDFSSVPVE